MKTDFPCTKCGLCCQHVDRSQETVFLDRGDGTCKHFDACTNTCSIYEVRPDICRVDKQFVLRYSSQLTWENFVYLNVQVCEKLAKEAIESNRSS